MATLFIHTLVASVIVARHNAFIFVRKKLWVQISQDIPQNKSNLILSDSKHVVLFFVNIPLCLNGFPT